MVRYMYAYNNNRGLHTKSNSSKHIYYARATRQTEKGSSILWEDSESPVGINKPSYHTRQKAHCLSILLVHRFSTIVIKNTFCKYS